MARGRTIVQEPECRAWRSRWRRRPPTGTAEPVRDCPRAAAGARTRIRAQGRTMIVAGVVEISTAASRARATTSPAYQAACGAASGRRTTKATRPATTRATIRATTGTGATTRARRAGTRRTRIRGNARGRRWSTSRRTELRRGFPTSCHGTKRIRKAATKATNAAQKRGTEVALRAASEVRRRTTITTGASEWMMVFHRRCQRKHTERNQRSLWARAL
mmetsp:Transcript_4258/g.10360  ORF Transcript_4258/g.10360 Transcript_4258/m.10360 type:complete len:219 (-) Transcript_4258:1735-2391(-)